MQSSARALLPLIVVCIIFFLLPVILSDILAKNHIDKNVLLGANALFFGISLISFTIQKRGMQNKNPHVFVRSVTGGMLIKMVFCIMAVICYVYLSGTAFNKRAIFLSLFLYLIYLFVEVVVIMKMNKKQHA
ncbi:MAG: hypothetical protein H7258_08315 [Ferruginibacter sp.]|nr:hypothetical protein [Ferruginibacter sp.]